jgi:hypothetical protein
VTLAQPLERSGRRLPQRYRLQIPATLALARKCGVAAGVTYRRWTVRELLLFPLAVHHGLIHPIDPDNARWGLKGKGASCTLPLPSACLMRAEALFPGPLRGYLELLICSQAFGDGRDAELALGRASRYPPLAGEVGGDALGPCGVGLARWLVCLRLLLAKNVELFGATRPNPFT